MADISEPKDSKSTGPEPNKEKERKEKASPLSQEEIKKDFLWKINDYNLQHFFLAFVIIIGFLILFAAALIIGVFAQDRTYELLGKVTSTLGPIAGGAVGYYFGQKTKS